MKCFSFSSTVKYFAIFLISFLLLFSCEAPEKELKVITFTGCEYVNNSSMHNIMFPYGSKVSPGDTNALLVSEGDLLNIEASLYFVYDNEYGDHLEIMEDTTEPGTIRINGKRHSLYMENDREFPEWISTLTSGEIAELKFLSLEGDTGKHLLESVRMIAGSNPNIGLSVEDPELLYGVLHLLHPSLLVIPWEAFDKKINEFITNLDHLEVLSLYVENLDSLDFIYRLPNLRVLMIFCEDSVGKDLIRVEKIPSLESLNISGVEMTSLDALGNTAQLSELILESGPLSDISQLREMKELRRLGIRPCDTLCDLSVLNEIQSLQWLAVPVYMSQAEFDELLGHHQSLEGLEILGNECIADFGALAQPEHLKALSISVPDIDYEALKQLSDIELIVIDEDTFDEDVNEIAALKEALPDTHIIPGGGFCMGSGWILLLLPVLLFAFVYRRFTGK